MTAKDAGHNELNNSFILAILVKRVGKEGNYDNNLTGMEGGKCFHP